ncbi:TetR/AcrR family transcriptional regulator C-terminal domain-containing protein [Salinactinospora qingdaonensis]|uniref:TetR/AcrR family transcriptional regulator n=1 Tax=Salinactinospora qingdaonensis TaxID=702744 RepID=A0ABP7G845_9ACTN
MATEYSGSGDPARSMALLWRTRERPSRKAAPELSVDRIVAAAIEIADADGMAAISMRRVAQRLGVGTMSLYTHVPGKAELVDVMLDAAYGEVAVGEHSCQDWRSRLEWLARQSWDLYHRHPWMVQVGTDRPVLGPNAMARYEDQLHALEGLGLSGIEMDAVVSLVEGHVEGAARRSLEAASTQRRTGVSDEQWWQARAPFLERLADAGRYPTASRVGTVVGAAFGSAHAPEHVFEFGLRRILDGVAMLVGQRCTEGDPD